MKIDSAYIIEIEECGRGSPGKKNGRKTLTLED
jgi:hypothetical protein